MGDADGHRVRDLPTGRRPAHGSKTHKPKSASAAPTPAEELPACPSHHTCSGGKRGRGRKGVRSLHAILIINPRAGRRPDARKLAAAIAWLVRRDWTVERRFTERPGHARELAAAAAAERVDAVIACGGDGTINEVVNGLAGSQTALAVLPSGTVNVWAREVQIPRDPLGALQLLAKGERRRVDLGLAGERRFLMLASVGTDSYAVQAVGPALKRRWGRYAYLFAGLRDLVKTGGRPLTIVMDDQTLAVQVLVAVIGNTRLYGGAMRATHRARIDDGLLDLCVYTGSSWGRMALHVARTLAGRHERDTGVRYEQIRELTVTSKTPVPVQVDGESAGETPMRFTVEPAALTVIVPRGLASPLFTAPTA
ncbi:MAG: diacylglycerol/lipid kinase family protein [Dehalococcoidia bacterium]